jgi:hypothetical protein
VADKPNAKPLRFGSEDLRLPEELRAPLRAHLAALRERYVQRGWAGRVGFGHSPALIVIDLARWWTDTREVRQGSDVDSVIEATCQLLEAARAAKMPIFFTTWDLGTVHAALASRSQSENGSEAGRREAV